jgi:hypothetical protein
MEKLSTEDKEFLKECSWFWQNKGDIERYIGFDREKLRRLDPILHAHWINYKVAISMLNSRATEIENF